MPGLYLVLVRRGTGPSEDLLQEMKHPFAPGMGSAASSCFICQDGSVGRGYLVSQRTAEGSYGHGCENAPGSWHDKMSTKTEIQMRSRSPLLNVKREVPEGRTPGAAAVGKEPERMREDLSSGRHGTCSCRIILARGRGVLPHAPEMTGR